MAFPLKEHILTRARGAEQICTRPENQRNNLPRPVLFPVLFVQSNLAIDVSPSCHKDVRYVRRR